MPHPPARCSIRLLLLVLIMVVLAVIVELFMTRNVEAAGVLGDPGTTANHAVQMEAKKP